MTYPTMCSATDINLLFNAFKFTAVILVPKYKSGTILLLFDVISKQYKCSKQRRHMLELKSVPEDLLTSILTVNDAFMIGNLNSCMIVNSDTLKTLGISNLCWSKTLMKSGSDHSCVYMLQILLLPKMEDKVGIITSALHYNLKQSSMMVGRTLMAEKIDVLQSFVPPIAILVKVGLLQNIDIDNSILDIALSNYFQYPRFLRIGEAFELDMFIYAPFYYQNFLNNRLFVKVTDIEGPHYKSRFDQDIHNGYYVQKEYSSLIQCENQQSYVPSTDTVFIKSTNNEKEDNFKYQILSNIPTGLESYRDELITCILPFIAATNNTSQLKPIFLLSGPHGVGKECIIKNVSEALGLYLKDFDSFELQGGSPGYAEGRLKYVFSKVQQCAPCILHIKNVEVLCKDKNGNEDDRVANAFIDEIQRLFREIVLPVIIIVTCNSKDGNAVIAPMLTRMFLHSIHMEIPDDGKRLAMLQWLLKKYGMIAHADLSYIVSQTSGYLYEDLVVLLSLVIRNMYKRTRKNGKHNSKDLMLTKIDFEESLNAMQATYSSAIDAPKIPKVSWDDIGGLMDLKKEITRTVMLPLQRPELLAAGLRRSGILLYGPPGTGKTLLAKAIATECNLNFLSVKGPELLNMYVGQSEENVREVFEKARAASPCIIFFDELDSLAPNRGKSGDSGGVMDRVVSQMLAELDGLQKSKLLFVIGATNRPDLIDPALLRPGRFEKLLHVGVCEDRNSKLSIMQTLTKRFKLKNDMNLEDVVNSLPNKLTGADIYAVCSQAWLIAVRNHIHSLISVEPSASSIIEVGMMDFGEAVKYLMPSVSEDELVYYMRMNEQM